MSSESNSPIFVPPSKKANDGREFEWLLCLASTVQACRREPSGELKAAKQESRPKDLVATASAWAHRPLGHLIRGPLSLWREIRSKHRGAA
jgi:hypothetical protein